MEVPSEEREPPNGSYRVTNIELDGFKLDLPNDHWLPQIRNQLPDYGENIGRLAAAVEGKYPGRGFIDVGANVGDTAAIVRAHSNLPILCIEGSEFFYELLKENIRQLKGEIELECTLVDSASAERKGSLSVEYGTASFQTDSNDSASRRFARLDSILARHPRFQSSKILKIDTDGMDGRILAGALEWISVARPVLFWEHDIGRDAAAGGPGLDIFERLLEIGYRTGVVFDNTGEFIQAVSLDARQQLADLSDYLPGGEQFYGYCDVCAFHEEDLDLCSLVRRMELERRRVRRDSGPKPLNEPLFRALVQAQFEVHGAQLDQSIRRCLKDELQGINAQTHFDHFRQQLRIADLETQVSSKDAEVHRLHVMLRELLVELLVERNAKNRREQMLHEAALNELRGQLTNAREEGELMRREIDSSFALRAAKAAGWILGPLRRLLGRSSTGGRS
jgi:FkbM family methyltransferase